MNKKKKPILTCLLAALLMLSAFSLPVFAYSADTQTETTGGIEYDTEETEAAETEEAETEDSAGEAASLDEETRALLSAFAGAQVSIAVSEDGIQITSAGESETTQTGTVTTNGGSLNVRSGAGMEYSPFTQLADGTEVEVIGTEGEWVKIRLPEREGYVYSSYLTVEETAVSESSFAMSLTEEELSYLLELFGGSLNSSALTPDGNLSLIDDIGSSTESGKQFVTLETKNGAVFYLIIDRDDDGEETVHFLNQVDEADLEALLEEDGTDTLVCSCTERCAAGAVNTDCELCAQDMTACVGKEAEPEETEETVESEESEPEETAFGGIHPAVILLVLVLVGGGAAAAYFKLVKNKAAAKPIHSEDDYDYGEDEDEEEVWETEQEDPDDGDSEADGDETEGEDETP